MLGAALSKLRLCSLISQAEQLNTHIASREEMNSKQVNMHLEGPLDCSLNWQKRVQPFTQTLRTVQKSNQANACLTSAHKVQAYFDSLAARLIC